MWQTFLIALCLVMVIEGLLPFLSPKRWRETVLNAASLPDRTLRLIGLASMMIGTLLLYIVH